MPDTVQARNGGYSLVFKDADGATRPRQSVWKTYVVYKHGVELCSGRLRTPTEGSISKKGTVLINCRGARLGTSLLFSADNTGKILLRHQFKANIYNSGISANGLYAVCQTANSRSSDGSCLFLFDLDLGQCLWGRKNTRHRWAREYRINTKKKVLYLIHYDRSEYRYSFRGDFIDETKYDADEEALSIDNIAGHRVSWRIKALRAPVSLTKRDHIVLQALYRGVSTTSEAAVLTKLKDHNLIDDSNVITNRGLVELALKLPLQEQCRVMGIKYERINTLNVPKGVSVERTALEHFEAKGYNGGFWGGYPILFTIYGLCFQRLDEEIMVEKKKQRFLYHGGLTAFASIFPSLEGALLHAVLNTKPENLMDNIKRLKGMRGNEYQSLFNITERTAALDYSYSIDRPALDDVSAIAKIYSVLGPSKLANILRMYFQDPFAFSKGWPDLVLFRGDRVRFAEIKTTDKLHRSQLITIPDMARAGQLDISVVCIQD